MSRLQDNEFDLGAKETFTKPEGSVCEHVLELNILRDVMERPGAHATSFLTCAGEPTPGTEFKKRIAPLVKIIHTKSLNVVLTQKASLEGQKDLIVARALGRGTNLDVPGRRTEGVTSPNTLQVAAKLDAAIQGEFPGTRARVVGGSLISHSPWHEWRMGEYNVFGRM
ncbi:hypothetical protein FB451DRAFT_1487248 [Mycena latifolia]|nr:hypothetical protein FB451DRAFT_1487248 [Mycena latifolia]